MEFIFLLSFYNSINASRNIFGMANDVIKSQIYNKPSDGAVSRKALPPLDKKQIKVPFLFNLARNMCKLANGKNLGDFFTRVAFFVYSLLTKT